MQMHKVKKGNRMNTNTEATSKVIEDACNFILDLTARSEAGFRARYDFLNGSTGYIYKSGSSFRELHEGMSDLAVQVLTEVEAGRVVNGKVTVTIPQILPDNFKDSPRVATRSIPTTCLTVKKIIRAFWDYVLEDLFSSTEVFFEPMTKPVPGLGHPNTDVTLLELQIFFLHVHSVETGNPSVLPVKSLPLCLTVIQKVNPEAFDFWFDEDSWMHDPTDGPELFISEPTDVLKDWASMTEAEIRNLASEILGQSQGVSVDLEALFTAIDSGTLKLAKERISKGSPRIRYRNPKRPDLPSMEWAPARVISSVPLSDVERGYEPVEDIKTGRTVEYDFPVSVRYA